jgi:hypothetical protein
MTTLCFVSDEFKWTVKVFNSNFRLLDIKINARNKTNMTVIYLCVRRIDFAFCQCLATGQWLSPVTPVSSNNTTDRHDITEISLKVALNTITHNPLWRIYYWILELLRQCGIYFSCYFKNCSCCGYVLFYIWQIIYFRCTLKQYNVRLLNINSTRINDFPQTSCCCNYILYLR